MSTYLHAVVRCDHRNPEAPAGERWCHESVEEGFTRAAARKAAKALGWTVNIRSEIARRYRRAGKDFCPSHKPEPEETP